MSGPPVFGYVAGILTYPALIALVITWLRTRVWLARRGITFNLKWHRDLNGVSDYLLSHDIWWERAFGPVFVGGWYHERLFYEGPNEARFNRWVGLGRTEGPCFAAYLSRELGQVKTAPVPVAAPDEEGTL